MFTPGHQIAEKVRRGEPLPAVIGAVLSAAAVGMRFGMWLRLQRTRSRVPALVISFGNITVGGTGKTPAVIERAQRELAAGRRVAVLTRGYRARKGPEPLVITPDAGIEGLAERVGDEPALIARRAPGVILVKAANRVAGARVAVNEYGCDVLILDDGFQHVALERNENCLMIDATNPFGNGCLLPRGILREPLSAMKRATSVILTHCDQAADLEGVIKQVRTLCPGAPLRKTRHAPCGLWRVEDGTPADLEMIQGREVTAACGIANPEAFFRTLTALGTTITARLAYRDHRPIPRSALPVLGIVITTEKDAVRMNSAAPNVYALAVELRDV